MKIVLFNGAPRSGKDAVAKELFLTLHFGYGFNVWRYKFASAIKNPIKAMFNLTEEEFEKYFESPEKDKPQERFFGKTPRAVLISFSEEWAKPLFGKRIFGQIAGQTISQKNNDVIVISDCGFQEELDGLFEYIGPKNCIIYRLERKGASYAALGDSRKYIHDSSVLLNKPLDNNRPLCEVVKDVLTDLENLGIVDKQEYDDGIPF